ncbi:PREDICTED: LOW QUALITY PROTEIN: zinc finger matrin-type protein 1-like, partial [Merops nubicus]|uniref:LOW QUALITY PROTEIN: zinc finger matrin-type protein 1-like n=1 Tax=Merops nubicus TaxID=57421 RepID=UPI0004F059A1
WGNKGRPFTNGFCKVCGAVLQFKSQRASHYKIDRNGILENSRYCSLCCVCFTSPVVVLSHYLGRIHAEKLKQLSGDSFQKSSAEKPLLSSTAEESSSSNTRLKLNDSYNYCKLCCVIFNNPLVAQEHYRGKKDRRNEARKKILEKLGDKSVPAESSTNGCFFSAVGVGYYVCLLCNVITASMGVYQSPLQGYKHWIKPADKSFVTIPLWFELPDFFISPVVCYTVKKSKHLRWPPSEIRASACQLQNLKTSTSFSRKEQKFQIKHSEEENYTSEEKEATKQKRNKNSESADFGKENEKEKIIKFEIDLVSEKKSRPYKNKRLKGNPTEKKSKKDKKKPQTDGKREEELLWAESVQRY